MKKVSKSGMIETGWASVALSVSTGQVDGSPPAALRVPFRIVSTGGGVDGKRGSHSRCICLAYGKA